MAYIRQSVSQYKGRYFRTIGKVINARGTLQPKKVLLGTDRVAAELANKLLEKLWAEVVAEHEHVVEWMDRIGGRLADMNLVTGRMGGWRRDYLALGPHWRAESLMIAEAIRQGRRELAVQVRPEEPAPDYVQRVAALARTYSVVAFFPADPEQYAAGRQALMEEAGGQLHEARRGVTETAQLTEHPVPVEGPTLYEAFDAYASSVSERASVKEHGKLEADRARRLKDAVSDMPLERFGLSVLQRLGDYWRARPKSKRRGGKTTNQPIALDTVRIMLRTASRFVRWLDRSEGWAWEAPRYWEDALRANVKQLRTPEEVAKLKDGVAVWTVDELVRLYKYATDQDRLFILLGLNLGAAQAEIYTLRRDELDRKADPPLVQRIRVKTTVFGQWPLWPETLAALDWHQRRRRGVRPVAGQEPYLLLTSNGRQFDRQRISNAWSRLLDRVRKEFPSFRRLSFKHLRKTAYQLVRSRSDGEVAGVFIAHGRPVASDELSDVYGNRPFEKVAEALDAVHADLAPMFEAAPNAFTKPQTRRRRSTARTKAAKP